MTGTRTATCSFCGRTAEQAGLLMQGHQAAICEDCCHTGLELADDHRAGTLSQDGRIRIADYPVDLQLARSIGEPSLSRFPFVPLSVHTERVVVALTDVKQMKEIQTLVAGVLSRVTGSPQSTETIDAVLADSTAILAKIRDALGAKSD